MSESQLYAIKGVSFILTVKVTIASENVPKYFEHFKPVYDAVLAEPECMYFIVGTPQAVNDKEVVLWWTEGWAKDVEWFQNVQMKKTYYEPYIAVTQPMWVKDRVFEIRDPVEGFGHFKSSD